MTSYHLQSLEDIPGVTKQFLDEFGHNKVFAFDGEMGGWKNNLYFSIVVGNGYPGT